MKIENGLSGQFGNLRVVQKEPFLGLRPDLYLSQNLETVVPLTIGRAEVIKKHIEAEYVDSTPSREKQVKELFSKMNNDQLQGVFGKEGLGLVYIAVNKWNSFQERIEKEMPSKREIEEFTKKYGYLNLSLEIDTYSSFKPTEDVIYCLYDELIINKKKLEKTNFKPKLDEKIMILEKKFNDFVERKRKEGPVKLMGFDKFDSSKIKGNEIAEKAVAILPNGRLTDLNSLSAIYYSDISERGGGTYDSVSKKIILNSTENVVSLLPHRIAHEYGHSIDPRFAILKPFTLKEQLPLIGKWEEIRKEEPLKVSFYCSSFEQRDKKDVEGYAESIRRILTSPLEFKDAAPKRYGFFLSLFQKLYPEFKTSMESRLRQNMEKMKEYNNLLFDLGYASTDSALESVEHDFLRRKKDRNERRKK